MIFLNLLDKVNHSEPHLCIQLTDAQHDEINDVVERARKLYGKGLDDCVMMAFRLLRGDIEVMESALNGKGRKVG